MNATVPLPSDPASAPKKGGSGKLIALIVGICLFLFVAFVGGILFFVFSMMKSNGAYKGAVDRAHKHPEVVAALGEPLIEGFFLSGSINTVNDSGNADLSIPISGPKGAGTLRVVAEMTQGVWTFQQLRFSSGAKTVSLLQAEQSETPPELPPQTSGTVKWFNKEKGFGFITPSAGGKDLFVHFSEIVTNGERTLSEGQSVDFDIVQDSKGPKAVRVRVK